MECINQELVMQQEYLSKEPVSSIYFGGGTPSLMSSKELNATLETIANYYSLADNVEITIEANPENINDENLGHYYDEGINRLSLGVQSFNDRLLRYLNRVHSSSEAIASLECIEKSNINNYSLDLIFGISEDDHDIWAEDLDTAIAFKPNHLSLYNLTIEDSTVFGNWLKKGKIQLVSEEHSAEGYEYAHSLLTSKGYDHYEISNYCLPRHHSHHNTSYWNNEKYLGIGPGAHSFNVVSRQFNVNNNAKYIESIKSGEIAYSLETLTRSDKINEQIMTGLRTKWGCDLQALKDHFQFDLIKRRHSIIDELIRKNFMLINEEKLILTLPGQLIADHISSELMIEPLEPDLV